MTKKIPIGSAACPYCDSVYRSRYLPEHIKLKHESESTAYSENNRPQEVSLADCPHCRKNLEKAEASEKALAEAQAAFEVAIKNFQLKGHDGDCPHSIAKRT